MRSAGFVPDRCRKDPRPGAEQSYRILLHKLSYRGVVTAGSTSVNEERVDGRAKTHFLKELGNPLAGERTADLKDPILLDCHFLCYLRGERVCVGTRGYAFRVERGIEVRDVDGPQ